MVAAIVFALVYLALYPGLGNLAGFLGWTQEDQHAEEVADRLAVLPELGGRARAELDVPELGGKSLVCATTKFSFSGTASS